MEGCRPASWTLSTSLSSVQTQTTNLQHSHSPLPIARLFVHQHPPCNSRSPPLSPSWLPWPKPHLPWRHASSRPRSPSRAPPGRLIPVPNSRSPSPAMAPLSPSVRRRPLLPCSVLDLGCPDTNANAHYSQSPQHLPHQVPGWCDLHFLRQGWQRHDHCGSADCRCRPSTDADFGRLPGFLIGCDGIGLIRYGDAGEAKLENREK